MSVVTQCGAVSLLLSLLMAAPAMAQSPQGGTSWSDPPPRAPENAAPAKPADGTPAAKAPVAETAPAATPTPAERAAATLGVKPADPAKQASSTAAIHTQRAVVRPRMVERPMVITRRRARVAERPRPSERIARRAGQRYAVVPHHRGDDRRGSSAESRRLAGWGSLIGENQASRIAAAREAGYTLMRLRTYENPDGSRFQRLVPIDGDGLGDLD
ncbi:hypothetical protein [Methylobacterium gnaphalii]|uniref:Uncharacterized protein n=1 Tax=Methylobacterium gnaphalii TaxID=1010610 RepID=A0A512JGD8_9HYPH|nr:hypothetical protein [Methylobacterium gnaphalii]GEP09020.1 hypothetical protein MGN01_08650 [Methylobacterium gnaphalii]GJD67562.1 hypothetical protein MMMDOFMJ_0478 [Methylobacterium gnaphalii]GLS48943.1 hypothetical protein GCM10007885_17900 [Methylobacterium gnaphalii]